MKKPSGLVCGPVNSDGATLAVVNHLQQEDVIFNKTTEAYQVTEQTYSIPCTGRDSCEAPSEFLVQSSASLSLFNICGTLIQQEKAKMFKRKQETERRCQHTKLKKMF